MAALLREALRRGMTHITLKLSVNSAVTSIGSMMSPSPISPASVLKLNVAAPRSAQIDVLDADGRVLASNQRIVDMRNFDAGQYILRVHADRPEQALTSSLPFQLEINAPLAVKLGLHSPV